MSKIYFQADRAGVSKTYRGNVLTVEPYGIEEISPQERHGRIRTLFTLWFSANMGLPVWLVGGLFPYARDFFYITRK